MDDDSLVLNLALPEDTGGAVQPSRSQQRKLKWSEQRALKVGSRLLLLESASSAFRLPSCSTHLLLIK